MGRTEWEQRIMGEQEVCERGKRERTGQRCDSLSNLQIRRQVYNDQTLNPAAQTLERPWVKKMN
jgi:hypothetical protein